MPDMGMEPTEAYKEIIREAYINPIRSVIVVDDEFPTLEGLLSSKHEEKNEDGVAKADWRWEGKPEDALRVEKLLNVCRKYSWTVDIHDGQNYDKDSDENSELKIASHLHQSDLLILDYQLEGDGGDGGKAIEILRELAVNPHFNIVLIYTNSDISRIFPDLIFSLLPPDEKLLHFESYESFEDALEEWEIEEEGIFKLFEDIIDHNIYLKYRNGGKFNFSSILREQELRPIRDAFKRKPKGVKISSAKIVHFFLHNIQKKLGERLFEGNVSQLNWGNDAKGGWNWIRIDKLFLTVIKKDVEADKLIEQLEIAIQKWEPDPHRLIISKMRAELDEHGVVLEDAVLENRLMQAGWFAEILGLNDRKEERRIRLSTLISHQWESLLSRMIKPVLRFAEKVTDHETDRWEEPIEGVLQHFNVDMRDKKQTQAVLLNSNCHFCSKKPQGWHLTTGHVMKIDGEYWICLSPACDLVPEQKTGGRYRSLQPAMPFKAVKLHPFSKKTIKDALLKADSNICIFLHVENEIKAFQFTPINNPFANPIWEEMFASEYGKFASGSKSLDIARLKWDEDDKKVTSTWSNATVVAQLRYEYALNLLQRLTSTLSRIGLDFISSKNQNAVFKIDGKTDP